MFKNDWYYYCYIFINTDCDQLYSPQMNCTYDQFADSLHSCLHWGWCVIMIRSSGLNLFATQYHHQQFTTERKIINEIIHTFIKMTGIIKYLNETWQKCLTLCRILNKSVTRNLHLPSIIIFLHLISKIEWMSEILSINISSTQTFPFIFTSKS